MPLSRRQTLALTAYASLWAGASGVRAQSGPRPPADDDFKPSSGQAGKDVVWVPTPDAVVDRMLQMAEVKAGDRVFDLGSGDGKIAIAAARKYGAQATGLEYNPKMVALSSRMAREAGVADKVTFREADIFVSDFSSATVVTLYLLPELNLRLRPKLFQMPPGTRVVSHSFDMGDWAADEEARAGSGYVYLWRVPANVSGEWRVSAPQLAHPPARLELAQKYQVVSGHGVYENRLRAGLVRPHLSGDLLSFGLRDAAGTLLQFSGRAAGNRITGTVLQGTSQLPFQAERTQGERPIAAAAGAGRS